MGRSSRLVCVTTPARFALDYARKRSPAGGATEPLKRRAGRGSEKIVAAGAVAGPPGFFLRFFSVMTHARPPNARARLRLACAGGGSALGAAACRSASRGISAGHASATSAWLVPGIPDCSSARASSPAGSSSHSPSKDTLASEGAAEFFFCALDARPCLIDALLGPRELQSPRRPSLVGKFAASLRGAFFP